MGEFEQNARLHKQQQEELKKNKQRLAQNDLQKKIRISIETPVIGMLEEIENSIGYLWGHNVQLPTPEQQAFREDYWEPLRKATLDRMNKAIQTSLFHLGRFTFDYAVDDKKYHVHFSQ